MSLTASAAVKSHATLAPAKASFEKAASLQATNLRAGVYGAARTMAPRRAVGDTPDTMYMAPAGTFFNAPWEGSDGYYHSYYGFMVAPNVPLTWTQNYLGYDDANGNFVEFDETANTFQWAYYDPELQGAGEAEGPSFTVTYPGTLEYSYPAPMLFINGATTGYQLLPGRTDMSIGNTLTFEIADEGINNMVSAQNIDFDNITIASGFEPSVKPDLDNGWDPNAYWTEYVAPRIGYDSLAVAGIYEYIPYGGAPYALKTVYMPAYVIASTGGKVTVEVCKITENGVDLDNPIATATHEFEEDQPFGRVDMYFTFKNVDEFGLEEKATVEVDSDIALVIRDVYTDRLVQHFRPLNFAAVDPFCDNYDYVQTGRVLLRAFTGEEETAMVVRGNYGGHYWYLDSDHTKSGLPAAFYITLDVEYPFIYTEEPVDSLEFAVEGETKTIEVIANKEFDEWNLEAPEWLTVEGENAYETVTTSAGEQVEYFTGNIAVTATAEAATEYREGYITISTPGAEYKVFCFQGEKPYVPVFQQGDLTGDGRVDANDLNVLISIILGQDEASNYGDRANVDGLGDINGEDLNVLIRILIYR